MAGILTKGIKLSYSTSSSGSFTALTNLQEIPDLGGNKDTIEVTTLEDAAHVYTDGLENYGDSLDFKFLYEPTQFTTLQGLSGELHWKVELPDGASGALDTACTFTGSCSVKLESKGVNDVLTYVLSVRPSSAMVFA